MELYFLFNSRVLMYFCAPLWPQKKWTNSIFLRNRYKILRIDRKFWRWLKNMLIWNSVGTKPFTPISIRPSCLIYLISKSVAYNSCFRFWANFIPKFSKVDGINCWFRTNIFFPTEDRGYEIYIRFGLS